MLAQRVNDTLFSSRTLGCRLWLLGPYSCQVSGPSGLCSAAKLLDKCRWVGTRWLQLNEAYANSCAPHCPFKSRIRALYGVPETVVENQLLFTDIPILSQISRHSLNHEGFLARSVQPSGRTVETRPGSARLGIDLQSLLCDSAPAGIISCPTMSCH